MRRAGRISHKLTWIAWRSLSGGATPHSFVQHSKSKLKSGEGTVRVEHVRDPKTGEYRGLRGPSGRLYELIVGLEVHAQLSTKRKLFSRASASFLAEPNTRVAPTDMALPGTLPVLDTANPECVRQAVIAGLALGGTIQPCSRFDRKHYFYCDLPAGYQITQQFSPIITGGQLSIVLRSGLERIVRISRIQLEQDSGRSLHDQHPRLTFINLNRAGMALIEVVSEPDMRSSEEAGAYFHKLHHLLTHIGAVEGTLAEGVMRCDANVSIRPMPPPPGKEGYLGVRCEIKNINSVRHLMTAIDAEAVRHVTLLESGQPLRSETRGFSMKDGTTVFLRAKEAEQDYRYFPEPDLPPLVIAPDFVEAIRATMPELPDVTVKKLQERYGLSAYDASVLVSEGRQLVAFFDALVHGGKGRDPKLTANWVTNELFGLLHEHNHTFSDLPEGFPLGDLLDLMTSETISNRTAKAVLEIMIQRIFGLKGENTTSSIDPTTIVAEKGWSQISDRNVLSEICAAVVADSPKEVAKFKAGNFRMMKHFVGEVMKRTGGRAHPELTNELLKKFIEDAK